MSEEEEQLAWIAHYHWSHPQSKQLLSQHINDWAANDNGITNGVTSSVEADLVMLHRVLHYILHCGYHAMYVMDA